MEYNKQKVKVLEIGSTGTENYAGYLSEEYLQELTGTQAADIYDKMRRSDPKIKMILSAIKGPIKGANWSIETIEESPEAENQKKLIEYIIFNDLDKEWSKKLSEILTLFDFGYSIFEKTHKVVLSSPVGPYIGLKSLAFRSQKTIERFNQVESGKLKSISQYAYGDTGKVVEIDSEFLVRFVLDEEGDNFEGISLLRPCYGPWLRKNVFLKLIAAGTEKYAIPIPVLEIPDGQFANDEYTAQYNKAIETLKRYTSNQINYITKPAGWNLTLQSNPFDAEKVRSVINQENTEMVNASLANFLELGNGTGSYALSTDLSDFFLGAIEFVSKTICETINKYVIDELIKFNFTSGKRLVELKCDGVKDKAGQEFANILKTLSDSKVIIPDEKLEENVRKRYNLPKREESTEREVDDVSSSSGQGGWGNQKKFAESKKKIQNATTKIMDKYAAIYQDILKKNLDDFKFQIADQVIRKYKKLTPSTVYKATNDISIKGIADFKSQLSNEFFNQYIETQELLRSKYPQLKRVQFARADRLAGKQKDRIATTIAIFVNTSQNDLIKAAQLSFLNSVDSTDSESEIKNNMMVEMDGKIDDITGSAPEIYATKNYNDASLDIFYNSEEVESLTFINPDPVTDICNELNGTTFEIDDPQIDEYRPPLHFNCKSYYVPNFSGMKGNPEITGDDLTLSKKAQSQKQI